MALLENKSNYVVTENNGDIELYSYKSLVVTWHDSKSGSCGFDGVLKFGVDYNFSRTTKKHIRMFLNKYTLFGNMDIEKSIDRGFVYGNGIYKQNIAVLYDETMK